MAKMMKFEGIFLVYDN